MNQNVDHGPVEARYSIGEFAKLTSVTERTLRFYDRKGLLKPTAYNSQGHRLYTQQDLFQLQKILTYKFLGFSLEEIGRLLNNSEESLTETLANQSQLLKQKKQKLEHMIDTVDHLLNLVPESHDYSNDLLLALIHSIQHEEDQKRWLSQILPNEIIDGLFLDPQSPERLMYDRKMAGLLGELLRYRREDRQPDDPLVSEKALEIVQLISEILPNGAFQQLFQHPLVQEGDNPDEQLDPFLFPSGFSPEEEQFLSEVFKQLEHDEQFQLLLTVESDNKNEGQG
ncbi:MerR family transcriptional regulator [Paenibacillus senegalensis]|uniref:MerR family transcriptional regulator n=1 Tax=Paenibacillus senegalensis TaxID=1465766 RepID=UPI000288AE42|nr:MerR family transcriptional regulator [Paenibacillus senegalensis]